MRILWSRPTAMVAADESAVTTNHDRATERSQNQAVACAIAPWQFRHLCSRAILCMSVMSSHKDVRLGPHVSPHQRDLLVAFMEKHAFLVTASRVPSPEATMERKRELWEEIAALLNAEGPARKSLRKWQAFWRKEVFLSRRDAAETRSGGRLSGVRGRIMQLVGPATVTGLCEQRRSQPLDELAVDVFVARLLEDTTPGTSGLASETNIGVANLQQADSHSQSPPDELTAGPSSAETSQSQRTHRQCRSSRRVSYHEALLERVAKDCARTAAQNEETNKILHGVLKGVAQMATASVRQAWAAERMAAAAERQSELLADVLRHVGQISPLVAFLPEGAAARGPQ
ncbi:uncharacterized protein [Dermacentor andersoni]|uniref:uncharacterized protein isoform X2 n=1 Tax=Dermacentor andersoni TaxID=34620 RepID=UPI003B3B6B0C